MTGISTCEDWGKATAAKGTFPYPHRTQAQIMRAEALGTACFVCNGLVRLLCNNNDCPIPR